MKILIIIDQFSIGGAARVVSRLLDGFCGSGHKVILATKDEDRTKMYPIPLGVEVVYFEPVSVQRNHSIFDSLSMHRKYILQCRHWIKQYKPDVVISEQTYLWVFFAALGTRIPVVAHDHTSFLRKVNKSVDFTRYHLYGTSDAVVILTQRDNKALGKKYPQKRVIYNPLPFGLASAPSRHRRKSILCVGRFDVWQVKGFDIIVEVFARLSKIHTDWNLEFAGCGTDQSMEIIRKMVEEKGIKNRVVFHGQVSDMQELYRKVQIFALPSRVEGLPMGLMEAMSQGCACVAFEVGGATNEMITQGTSGYYVKDGDVVDFECKLDLLMSDERASDAMGHKAIIESAKFSLDKVMKDWNDLLNNLCNKKR